VEEVVRIKPRTMSELMEVANRFADGEDAYNNKRGCSPEVYNKQAKAKIPQWRQPRKAKSDSHGI
jgi:hypothetical protein